MFQTVPLSINRSSSLYTQQWYMSYMLACSMMKYPLIISNKTGYVHINVTLRHIRATIVAVEKQ